MLALGALNGIVQATTINLTNNGCNNCSTSGDLGAGVYATVTYVQDADSKSLDFTLSLATDSSGNVVHFHNPSDTSHATFAFSLAGDPTVTATNFNVNNGSWTLSAPTKALSGSGTFDYVLADTAGGSGYAGGETGPITFKITPSTGALTTASVIQNSQNTTFNIDIVDANKSTGNVWDTTLGSPEPTTSATLGLAVGLLAFLRWRAGRKSPV